MPENVHSQAQARLLGALAGGSSRARRKAKGLSPAKAKEMLRGVKVKRLPKRKSKGKGHFLSSALKKRPTTRYS